MSSVIVTPTRKKLKENDETPVLLAPTPIEMTVISEVDKIIGTNTTLELGNGSEFYGSGNVDSRFYTWKFRFASEQRVRHTNWTIAYDSELKYVVKTFVSYNSSYYLVGLWKTDVDDNETQYWYQGDTVTEDTYKFYGPRVTIQDTNFTLADDLIDEIEFDNENDKAKGGIVYLKAFNTNATSEIRQFKYGGVTYDSSEFWFKTDEINVYKDTSSTPSVTIWCKGILLHEEKQAEFVKVYRSAYSFTSQRISDQEIRVTQNDDNCDYGDINYPDTNPFLIPISEAFNRSVWFYTRSNVKSFYGRPKSFYFRLTGNYISDPAEIQNYFTYAEEIFGWRESENQTTNYKAYKPYTAETPVLYAPKDSYGVFDNSNDTIQRCEFEFGKDAENKTDYTTAIFLNPDLEFWAWTNMSYFEATYHTYVDTVKTVKMENLTMYPGTTDDYEYDTENPNVLYCEGMNVLLSGKLEIKTDTITQSDNTKKTFYPTNTNPAFDCNMLVTNGHTVDILIENNNLTCTVDDNNSDFDNFVFFGSHIYFGTNIHTSFRIMNSEFCGIPKKLYFGQYTKDEYTTRKSWSYFDYYTINAPQLERLYGPWIKITNPNGTPYYSVTVKDPFYTKVTAHGEGEDGDNPASSATTYEQKDITFCMYTPNDTELCFDNSREAVPYYEYEMVNNNVVFRRDSIAFNTNNVNFSTNNADEHIVVLDGIIDENKNLVKEVGAQANYTYIFNDLEIGSGVTLKVPGGVVVVKGDFVNDGFIDCGALYLVNQNKAYINNYIYAYDTSDKVFSAVLKDSIFAQQVETYIFELSDNHPWKEWSFELSYEDLTIPDFVYTIVFSKIVNPGSENDVTDDEFYAPNPYITNSSKYLYADIDIQDRLEFGSDESGLNFVAYGNYRYQIMPRSGDDIQKFFIIVHSNYNQEYAYGKIQMIDSPEFLLPRNYLFQPDLRYNSEITYQLYIDDDAYFSAENWMLYITTSKQEYPMTREMIHDKNNNPGYIRIAKEKIKSIDERENSESLITLYNGTNNGYKILTSKYRIGRTMIEIYEHEIVNKIVYGSGHINYGWYDYESAGIGSSATYTLNATLQIPVPISDGITYCTDVTIDSVEGQINNNNVISYVENEFQVGDILNTPGLVIPESNVLEVSNARVIIDTAKDGEVDVSGTLKCKELIIN